MNDHTPLKLKAKDAEDVQVVSAMLQDALVPIMDMTFDKANNQFILALSRFCWEKLNPVGQNMLRPCERVNCALRIEGVQGVKTQQVDLTKKGEILSLLAVMAEPQGLQLVFAGGPRLRIESTGWTMKLDDFGEPWPVNKAPCHEEIEKTA